jgi:hypothetical protein
VALDPAAAVAVFASFVFAFADDVLAGGGKGGLGIASQICKASDEMLHQKQ